MKLIKYSLNSYITIKFILENELELFCFKINEQQIYNICKMYYYNLLLYTSGNKRKNG